MISGENNIFKPDSLAQNGLNIHAVFDIKLLPHDIKNELIKNNLEEKFNQVILLGNGGKLFWDSLKKSKNTPKEPVDDFTLSLVNDWLKSLSPKISGKVIYPPSCELDLQKLGQLAGWHHSSPFMVGINNQWGTWFAYRAVILADSKFTTSHITEPEQSPCKTCVNRSCITQCPGEAVTGNNFSLEKCINYRKQKNSSCQTNCLSRISCPVATQHRYSEEQIHYHYSKSLQTIMKYT